MPERISDEELAVLVDWCTGWVGDSRWGRMASAARELQERRARDPVTADGVRVMLGDKVWIRGYGNISSQKITVQLNFPTECYSTPEAAAAARGKK